MKRTFVEVSQSLLNFLQDRDDIKIITQTYFGDGYYLLLVESSLIRHEWGISNIIVEDDTIRFSRDSDT